MTDFFEHLIRLLVLSRPSDPTSFLIEVLENRALQRLILVNSIVAPKRNEVVQSIANTFNYKVVSLPLE
jgi:adenylate kinase